MLLSAIEALRRPGGVVIYPTETLYALGCRATDGAAARRVAQLKGREPGSLVVLALDPPLVWALGLRLAAVFWPGPMSLVVPAWEGLAQEVLAADGTVAVRPPIHPLARRLVQAVGSITSTSANRSGEPPLQQLLGCALAADAIVDVGPLAPSRPSTLVRGDTGEILRQGAIPAEQVHAVLQGLSPPGKVE